MRPISIILIIPLLLSLAACTSGTVAPQSPVEGPTSLFGTASTATPPELVSPGSSATQPAGAGESPQAPAPTGSDFTVAVVVDVTTNQVTREQAQAAVDQASTMLREFSPHGLVMKEYAQDGSGGPMAGIADRFLAAQPSPLPDGLVIFSAGDNGQARTQGGYGFSVLAPNFRNRFVSPAVGDASVYVAVVDHSYRYMACGYGGADTASSATSLAGECRGQTGIPCVQHNGYSMCSNAVGNLYTLNPTYAVSSMIVHGLLHNFGPNGDADHYATDQCNARMGYPAGFFDLQESEYYNGLCPYVYEEFNNGYK